MRGSPPFCRCWFRCATSDFRSSASAAIVRNFQIRNVRPLQPMRTWRKNTGPGESRLIRSAIRANPDASTMSPGIVRATEFALFVLALPMWIVVAKLYGLYERDEERTDHSTTDDFAGVFHMITVCTALFAFGLYLTQLAHPSAGKLATFWSAAIVLVASGRALARGYCRRHVRDVGQLVGKKMLKHPEYGL